MREEPFTLIPLLLIKIYLNGKTLSAYRGKLSRSSKARASAKNSWKMRVNDEEEGHENRTISFYGRQGTFIRTL